MNLLVRDLTFLEFVLRPVESNLMLLFYTNNLGGYIWPQDRCSNKIFLQPLIVTVTNFGFILDTKIDFLHISSLSDIYYVFFEWSFAFLILSNESDHWRYLCCFLPDFQLSKNPIKFIRITSPDTWKY